METFQILQKIQPDLRVLIQSGLTKKEEIYEILTLGARGFLQKPYSLYELSHKIDEILSEV
jgi:DNA-binding NarL/FixJ family response regulator